MGNRLQLHNRLSEVLETTNLYYQQPENFKLKYPCAIYNQEAGNVKKASNKLYGYTSKYSVTFISNIEKDSVIIDMLNSFEYCSIERAFVNDNLYHYVFTLYY